MCGSVGLQCPVHHQLGGQLASKSGILHTANNQKLAVGTAWE